MRASHLASRAVQASGDDDTALCVPIRLLGECRIGAGTSGSALQYRKGWAVLAYLAVERGRRHPRTRLAALLWPDLSERAALTNLRQVLSNLNRTVATAVGDGVLHIDRESVRLCPVASMGLFDVDLIDSAGVQGGDASVWLAGAGTLLNGLSFDGCEEFEEWLAESRAWYAQRLAVARECVRDAAVIRGDWHTALVLARQLVAQDPWNEGHQRSLMRILAEKGEPDMALACYRALERGLREELAVEPHQDTRRLALAILQAGCLEKATHGTPARGRVVSRPQPRSLLAEAMAY